jgi:hypothetical protein
MESKSELNELLSDLKKANCKLVEIKEMVANIKADHKEQINGILAKIHKEVIEPILDKHVKKCEHLDALNIWLQVLKTIEQKE